MKTRVAQDTNKKNSYAFLLESEINIIIVENSMKVLQNLNIELLYD